MNLENLGGSRVAFDHPTSLLKDSHNMLPLDLLQRERPLILPGGTVAGNNSSSTSSVGPLHKMTARSMMFSSSRILPGQEYPASRVIASGAIFSIRFPILIMCCS
jgi:hypothetical protein